MVNESSVFESLRHFPYYEYVMAYQALDKRSIKINIKKKKKKKKIDVGTH